MSNIRHDNQRQSEQMVSKRSPFMLLHRILKYQIEVALDISFTTILDAFLSDRHDIRV
mgnify:CR=1 FL=1